MFGISMFMPDCVIVSNQVSSGEKDGKSPLLHQGTPSSSSDREVRHCRSALFFSLKLFRILCYALTFRTDFHNQHFDHCAEVCLNVHAALLVCRLQFQPLSITLTLFTLKTQYIMIISLLLVCRLCAFQTYILVFKNGIQYMPHLP